MKEDAEPQESQNRELVVDMVRNHDRAPSSWCDGGPFYPVWRAEELPASCWYPTVLEEVYFLPYAELLLAHLAVETLVLVMDGSVVGCGCVALMLHVLYKGRALPLAWRVRQGPKGHFPEDLHIALVELVRTCLPEGTPVVFLG